MNRIVRSKPKPPRFSGPPRVRHEPPTLDEAVVAAQGLADDVEQQVAIVAGLMDLPEDEVRAMVLSAPRTRTFGRAARGTTLTSRSSAVVVVRRRRVDPA